MPRYKLRAGHLAKLGACAQQVDLFHRLYPSGTEVDRYAIWEMISAGMQIGWADLLVDGELDRIYGEYPTKPMTDLYTALVADLIRHNYIPHMPARSDWLNERDRNLLMAIRARPFADIREAIWRRVRFLHERVAVTGPRDSGSSDPKSSHYLQLLVGEMIANWGGHRTGDLVGITRMVIADSSYHGSTSFSRQVVSDFCEECARRWNTNLVPHYAREYAVFIDTIDAIDD